MLSLLNPISKQFRTNSKRSKIGQKPLPAAVATNALIRRFKTQILKSEILATTADFETKNDLKSTWIINTVSKYPKKIIETAFLINICLFRRIKARVFIWKFWAKRNGTLFWKRLIVASPLCAINNSRRQFEFRRKLFLLNFWVQLGLC